MRISKLRKALPVIYALSIVALIATFIPALAHRAGGASRWIGWGPLHFQPAELGKFLAVLFVANQISKKIGHQENFRTGFLTYFLGLIPIYVLLLKQPDFGSVALMLATTCAMLIGCGTKLRYLAATFMALVPTAALLIMTSPYRKARVMGFLDPWSDPAHKGFQIIQSLLAFFSGQWFGVGLGNSREKLFYLPEAHNDFIFAVVGEELGLFGVVFFVMLFSVLIWRGLLAAQRARSGFSQALAIGITTLIGLQAFFNMAVVLGLLPTKGLPLPLISYGGSSIIMTLFLLGLLVQLSEKNV